MGGVSQAKWLRSQIKIEGAVMVLSAQWHGVQSRFHIYRSQAIPIDQSSNKSTCAIFQFAPHQHYYEYTGISKTGQPHIIDGSSVIKDIKHVIPVSRLEQELEPLLLRQLRWNLRPH